MAAGSSGARLERGEDAGIISSGVKQRASIAYTPKAVAKCYLSLVINVLIGRMGEMASAHLPQ
jgi:hypothetical protein